MAETLPTLLVPAYTTTSVEGVDHCSCTVKKDNDFPVPAGMSQTILTLAGNIEIIPGHREYG
jgi:hypothetical protein